MSFRDRKVITAGLLSADLRPAELLSAGLLSVGLLWIVLFVSCSGAASETYDVDGIYSFALTGLNGEQMHFADLRGKAVMLNAWATWCPPCLTEMPVFVRLYEKYKDKGLEIWGVSTDIAGKNVVEPMIEELGINYPVLLAKTSELTKIFGVSFRGLPVTIFFDAEGRIAYTHIGSADAYVDESKGETVESWFEEQILNILPGEY